MRLPHEMSPSRRCLGSMCRAAAYVAAGHLETLYTCSVEHWRIAHPNLPLRLLSLCDGEKAIFDTQLAEARTYCHDVHVNSTW